MSGAIRLGPGRSPRSAPHTCGHPGTGRRTGRKRPSRRPPRCRLLAAGRNLVGLFVDDVQHRVGHVDIVNARGHPVKIGVPADPAQQESFAELVQEHPALDNGDAVGLAQSSTGTQSLPGENCTAAAPCTSGFIRNRMPSSTPVNMVSRGGTDLSLASISPYRSARPTTELRWTASAWRCLEVRLLRADRQPH